MNFRSTQETSPLPPFEEIKNNLCIPKDCALFYSGQGSYAKKAQQWAMKGGDGHRVLSQLWKDSSYPNLWQNDMDASKLFFALASRAMAELASGIIHVMLPSDTQGTDRWRGTVWDLHKWPNLSSEVFEVIQVNPDNDYQETIKRGAARPQQRIQPHRRGSRRRHHWQKYQCRSQNRRRRARRQRLAAYKREVESKGNGFLLHV